VPFGERVLNIITVGAVIVFLATSAQSLGNRISKPASKKSLAVGSTLQLPGDQPVEKKRTLVIALQVECGFCEESIPFYKELLAANSGNLFHPVVIVPHAVRVGEALLQSGGLQVADVRQASFTQLRIAGTPTLIITDDNAVVTNIWTGKLSPRSQDQVFKKLGLRRTLSDSARQSHSRESRDIGTTLAQGAPVIDVRSRAQYTAGRITGSINIPLDELHSRLPHEVPVDMSGIVYCDQRPLCAVMFESTEGRTMCDIAADAIKEIGFSRLRMVRADLDALADSGLPVTRGGH
jgi:rhodanese-related sulfurtransferase